MKKFTKISLLLASIPLMLTSCEDLKKKAYCLETSNDPNFYVDEQYYKADTNKCYQISYYDILEVFYLITNPLNPEAKPEDYKYDFVWNEELKNSYFEFTDGLQGKEVTSAFKLAPNLVKIVCKGRVEDPKVTGGYIKVYRYAFSSDNKQIKDASLYAYLAAGVEGGLLVDKPVEYADAK